MIDYEKLKKAHELCDQWAKKEGIAVSIAVSFFVYDVRNTFILKRYIGREEEFKTIDALIEKLEDQVKPEPKYKIGDEVWHLLDIHYVWKDIIVDINPSANTPPEFIYSFKTIDGTYTILEDDLFCTKESLILHQLIHWQKLYQQYVRNDGMPTISVKKECDHEPSDDVYLISGATWIKCVKCGEFYR